MVDALNQYKNVPVKREGFGLTGYHTDFQLSGKGVWEVNFQVVD